MGINKDVTFVGFTATNELVAVITSLVENSGKKRSVWLEDHLWKLAAVRAEAKQLGIERPAERPPCGRRWPNTRGGGSRGGSFQGGGSKSNSKMRKRS